MYYQSVNHDAWACNIEKSTTLFEHHSKARSQCHRGPEQNPGPKLVTYKRNIPSCRQHCVAASGILIRGRGFHELVLVTFAYLRPLAEHGRGHVTDRKRQKETSFMDHDFFALHGVEGLAVAREGFHIRDALLGWYPPHHMPQPDISQVVAFSSSVNTFSFR